MLAWAVAAHAQQSLFEHYTTDRGLPSRRVHDMVCDGEGQLWLATDRGLSRYDGNSFRNYTTANGLAVNEVVRLFKDAAGRIWVYTPSAQWGFFSNEKIQPFSIKESAASQLRNRLLNDACITGNTISFSTILGSGRMDAQGNTDSLLNAYTYFFIHDSLCILTGSGGTEKPARLFVKTAKKSFVINLSVAAGFSKSRCIQLSNGNYLFSQNQEIISFNDSAFIARAFVEKSVEDILEDSEGKIWVALNGGGLLCYPFGSIASGGSIAYLGNKTVTAIAEDKQANLWFATPDDGIFFLKGIQHASYTSRPLYSGSTQGRRVQGIAQNGTVSAQPFAINNTDSLSIDTVAPTIYISGVKIMNRDTAVAAFYELPHQANLIEISFVGFAFRNSGRLQYRYKLEGVNKDWIYTDNSNVQYAALAPGRYKFMVSAINKDGFWSHSPAVMEFVIQPPFWDTWLFYIAIFTAAILLAGLYIRIRSYSIKRRAAIERQMFELEQQALRSQMNPHFIFNSLNSVQSFISENDAVSAERFLARFAKLIRLIFENSRQEFISVEKEVELLQHYLELEKLRFHGKFDYTIDIAMGVEPDITRLPPMLVQPYVENAILHGIMNKNEKGHISITFTLHEGLLKCVVQDDGIGREKAAEIKRKSGIGHTSSGMDIVSERLSILNRRYKDARIEVQVDDLKDEAGKANGTRITLAIPYEKVLRETKSK